VKLTKSSFYYSPKAKSPERMKAKADLVAHIEVICLEFPRYNYRRVTKQLQREGWVINHRMTLRRYCLFNRITQHPARLSLPFLSNHRGALHSFKIIVKEEWVPAVYC